MIDSLVKFKAEMEKTNNPVEISSEVWSSKIWEKLARKDYEEIILPFLKFQIRRAMHTMATIYKAYNEKKLHVEEFRDLQKLPALVKDTAQHAMGFRDKIKINPYILLQWQM